MPEQTVIFLPSSTAGSEPLEAAPYCDKIVVESDRRWEFVSLEDAIGWPRKQEQILRATKWAFPVFIEEGPLCSSGSPRPARKRSWIPACSSAAGALPASGGDCRPDRDFPLFVRWYREGKLKLDELVTRRYPLEQINEAVDDLEQGRILGRAIITYN